VGGAGPPRGIDGLVELGVHGKTGTAEVDDAEPANNNAWFAGFAAADPAQPTLAFAAVAYGVADHGRESAQLIADFLRRVRDDDHLRRRYFAGENPR
jgi:cell division protein FtsI/penicillin-binding protein 2